MESKFQFTSPRLRSAWFSLNDDYDFDSEEMIANPSFNLEVLELSYENNNAVVLLKIDINNKEESGEEDLKKSPFFCSVEIFDEFTWEGLNQDEVDAMVHINAPALLLSYARPIISNLVIASPLPNYNIPFINFQEQWNAE